MVKKIGSPRATRVIRFGNSRATRVSVVVGSRTTIAGIQ